MVIVYPNRNHNHTMILFHSLLPLITWAGDLSSLSQTLIHKLREKERLSACGWAKKWVYLGVSLEHTDPCLFSTVLLGTLFSQGTLGEWPHLLDGVQEPTLFVP